MMLVPDPSRPESRIACYELPGGALGALPAGEFATFRAGLDEATRAGLHVLWIPAKMGYGLKSQAQDALMQMSAGRGGASASVAFGAYQRALLRVNVLAWEGPGFGGEPCTPDAVDRLDPDAQLAAFALDEIARRNPMRRSGDPKSPGASGSPAAGAPPSTAG